MRGGGRSFRGGIEELPMKGSGAGRGEGWGQSDAFNDHEEATARAASRALPEILDQWGSLSKRGGENGRRGKSVTRGGSRAQLSGACHLRAARTARVSAAPFEEKRCPGRERPLCRPRGTVGTNVGGRLRDGRPRGDPRAILSLEGKAFRRFPPHSACGAWPFHGESLLLFSWHRWSFAALSRRETESAVMSLGGLCSFKTFVTMDRELLLLKIHLIVPRVSLCFAPSFLLTFYNCIIITIFLFLFFKKNPWS